MSKDENDSKKEYFKEKIIERQKEAKIVRKVVLRVSIVLVLLVMAVSTGGYFYINNALKPVDPSSEKKININIPIGSSATGIAQILEDKGIIKNAKVFKYYVKFKNESGFMAGDYELSPAMTFPEIVSSLKTGKVAEKIVFKITIPEGKQLKEIAFIISEKTDYSEQEVWEKLTDGDFVKELMQQYPNLLTDEILQKDIKFALEGYLFPATYSFYKENPSIEEIVKVMLDKTKQVVLEYSGEMDENEMSVHELLTMASLIEEEATKQADREQIASVFYNRLEIGMPLQTDPTVLYAKGEHKAKVYLKDLKIDDPYNTYENPGLTPGPIANAGISSIEAALNPEDTDYLYFLATPSGQVLFSHTLAEHNELKALHIE